MKSGSGSGSDILCKERASEEGELEGKKNQIRGRDMVTLRPENWRKLVASSLVTPSGFLVFRLNCVNDVCFFLLNSKRFQGRTILSNYDYSNLTTGIVTQACNPSYSF